MENSWYYANGNKKVGPVSFDQLKELVSNGSVQAGTMVLAPSAKAWATAESVQGLLTSATAAPMAIPVSCAAETAVPTAIPLPTGGGTPFRVAQSLLAQPSTSWATLGTLALSRWRAFSAPLKAGIIGGGAFLLLSVLLFFVVITLLVSHRMTNREVAQRSATAAPNDRADRQN